MKIAAKIRRYMEKYPTASAEEIAKKLGTTKAYVYIVRGKANKAARTEEPKPKKGDWVLTHVGTSNEPFNKPSNKVTPAPAATDVDATLAERGKRYGSFVGHAQVTMGLKVVISTHLEARNKFLEADQKEALDMICHKIGRIVNGDPNYADSWIDIAGYAKLVADRLETGKEV